MKVHAAIHSTGLLQYDKLAKAINPPGHPTTVTVVAMKDSKAASGRPTDEEVLAALGYKQEFKRAFAPLEVFGIAFSIIGLLPSIASVLFYAIPNGGGPAMVWGWLVASVFVLAIGVSMGELASAAPTSGGANANTIGAISAISSIDWGCAVQIMAAAGIGSGGEFEATSAQTLYAGSRIPSKLCLAVIIALPTATPPEFKNTAKFALWDFTNFNGWSNGFAFILSFNAPLWTIGSFDSSVHISEEASNAAIAVPWAITLAIAIAGIVGWAINMSLAFCMGTDLEALHNSAQPMALIFTQSFGEKGTLVIWAIVVIVQFMMGSSMLLAASRQTFAFSRDSALPFSSWLYRMNSFTGTPVNTVIFDGVLAILLGCLAFAGASAINAVFGLSIVGTYIAYAIPIAARYLGENNFKPGPFTLGAFGLPVAIIAVVFMMFMSIVFCFPSTAVTDAPDMNYTVVVLGGILSLSVVWYYFPRYGGVHWFTGPVRNIDDRAPEISRDSSDGSVEKEPLDVSVA
ncbi:hypothetical protein DXG01_016378 [Tephrocybe rancida]|nr:hypothetical protein DXG01_016378 [Tephrocybe rancida]